MEPNITFVFGTNATQTATTLTITKADLPGLTPSSTNTAESLLVGILLRAKTQLTPANQETNSEQSITIADGYTPSYAIRNSIQYRQDDITVSLQKPAGSLAIDPDDY